MRFTERSEVWWMPTSAAGSSSSVWRAPEKGAQGGQAHRAFFVYGFAKSHQANISDEEEAAFKKAARHVLELTDKQLATLIQNGQFSEVDDDD